MVCYMTRWVRVLVFVLLISALALVGVWWAQEANGPEVQQEVGSVVSSPAAQAAVTLEIVAADGSQKKFEQVALVEGETALDITRKVVPVETKGEGEGAFVTSVDGVAAQESQRQFWSLLINGQPSQVGAGSYVVKVGDSISWQLATY